MATPDNEPVGYRHILIMGAGAVGGYIGSLLHDAGHAVTMADSWPRQVDTVATDGLIVEATEGIATFWPTIIHFSALGHLDPRPDLILLCNKLYEMPAILSGIRAAGLSDIVVANLQNGMADHIVAEALGPLNVLGVIATGLNVAVVAPGRIRRDTPRRAGKVFQVGELHGGHTARVCQVAKLLDFVDTAAVIDDLAMQRWSKLSLNSLSSGLCAVSGLTVAALYSNEDARDLMARLGSEALLVSELAGFPLDGLLGVPAAHWHATAARDQHAKRRLYSAFSVQASRQSATYQSGMLQDLLRGRATEVDYFNGYIAKQARAFEHTAKTHAAVAKCVRRVERGDLAIRPKNLDDLSAGLYDA